eukprot:1634258-Alexandrium_andersonii.AAC.1
MDTASPSMSFDGPLISSERTVRPGMRSVTIGRIAAGVEVNENTSESRTWTPAGFFDAAQLHQ